MKALLEKTSVSKQKRLSPRSVVVLFFAVLVAALLVACAPRAAEEPSSAEAESGESAALTVEWSPESECEVCHITEAATEDAILCQAEGETGSRCVICHVSDEAALAEVHEGVSSADTMPKRLKDTEVSDDTCLSCHYETREALIQATEGVTAVTDSNGLAINPHNPGSTGTGHSTIKCANCHNPHQSATVQERAQSECASCHHQNVYECYPCHED